MTAKRTAGKRLSGALAALAATATLAMAPSASAAIDITAFDGGAFQLNGNPMTQAGSYPHIASTTFTLAEEVAADGYLYATEDLKDVVVDLPPGLIGNPQALPTCTELQLQGGQEGSLSLSAACPDGTQVGFITIYQNGDFDNNPDTTTAYRPLYNMAAPRGTAAVLGFNYGGALFHLLGELRHDGEAYQVRVSSLNAPQTIPLQGAGATVWGIPADPSHDEDRGNSSTTFACANPNQPPTCANPSPEPRKPFFALPTSCDGPVETFLSVTGWAGGSNSASFLSHGPGGSGDLIGGTGCENLDFSPTLKARPTTNVADSPTGLEVDLQVPQHDDPDEYAEAHLRDTTVTLPEGLVINPSGANGLDGCSSAEVGIDPDTGVPTNAPARCPDASKVATVEVETPLLDHPVPGSAYLADPYDNPFDSLLALYIALDDPISGTVAKIAGEVRPDPRTGRITSTFEDNPQVPFEHFRLDFFGGADASLRTPATCGSYSTTSELVPWSAPEPVTPADIATPRDDWQITQGPSGACANSPGELLNAPSFDAGTVSPISKQHSPFVLNLRREDGSQQFSAVTVRPPLGLVAKLAGTETCSDGALAAAAARDGNEEKASPSCPLGSEIGDVFAAAGAGPAPYWAPAKAYLAGPHRGAPLSMAVIAPAVAGPFDLGTIVSRVALHVDPKTAEITATSDPLPTILEGVPLDIRQILVRLDKPDFTLTGTSCDPSAVNGLLTSTLNQVAQLFSRYQLSDCARLPFKPRIALRLRGGTKRGQHPALTITVSPRPGDANIAYLSIAFPRSEFLENAHIRTICTRPDFAADRCPAGAVYGRASVTTPLLDYELSGNVYLRSSSNLLPDVVPDFRGPSYQPIRLESSGRTDSIRGGIRTTLDFVPDAPFTQAVVSMQGGNKGLLVNSRDICARAYRATVRYAAHNGLTYAVTPKMQVNCKGRRGRRRKGKRGAKKRGGASAVARRAAVR